jgi:hypothetical protein
MSLINISKRRGLVGVPSVMPEKISKGDEINVLDSIN